MFSYFRSTPPPPPPTDFGTLFVYAVIGWFIIKILNKLPTNRKKSKKNTKKKNKGFLSNVIGLESVKEEIRYYMDFITNKKKYKEWNVKLPKGILLCGPPGTGKTLLVKTMSKMLDIPIVSAAGSEFVEMYVGVGAARIRNLFNKAKKNKSCIIFIDELDAVGRRRNLDNNSERASTLNQLLVEMDGFEATDKIIVFAATNLVKYLDPALLRSGRFDKKIFFDPPNFLERKSLFELYLDDITIPCNLSYAILSDRTAGMTGADIANIANQAKINAIQRGQDGVSLLDEDIQVAIDEVMIGREKRERMLSDNEKERVAHHEAGHALMGYILKKSEPPIKVSIIPRGEAALGFSQPKPANKKLYTREAVLTQICVLLGGRCAEKLIYNDVSTGAADDIEKISQLVKQYNTSWGMDSDIGPLNPSYLGIIGENLSDELFQKCQKLVESLELFTFNTLKKHKRHVKSLAADLLKNETIVYDRIKELLPSRLENSLDTKH